MNPKAKDSSIYPQPHQPRSFPSVGSLLHRPKTWSSHLHLGAGTGNVLAPSVPDSGETNKTALPSGTSQPIRKTVLWQHRGCGSAGKGWLGGGERKGFPEAVTPGRIPELRKPHFEQRHHSGLLVTLEAG